MYTYKKHLLLIDLSIAGHHTIYLENLTKIFIDEGFKVTVGIYKKHQNNNLIKNIEFKYPNNFNFHYFNDDNLLEKLRPKIGNLGRELINWLIFKYLYIEINKKLKIDFVFLPFLDDISNAIGILGSPFLKCKWFGLSMKSNLHYFYYGFTEKNTLNNYIQSRLFIRLLNNKTLINIFCIDELFVEYIRCNFLFNVDKINYIPDPADPIVYHEKNEARNLLGIPLDKIVILIYGDINIRKGLDVIVKALTYPEISTLYHLLIVGEQDITIKEIIHSNEYLKLLEENRIHVINKFVDFSTQNLVFSCSDIVWLGYRNHLSMSGVMVLAALSNIINISTKEGLIGKYSRDKNLGLNIDINDISTVINVLIEFSDVKRLISHRSKIEKFFNFHTWNNVKNIIVNKIYVKN